MSVTVHVNNKSLWLVFCANLSKAEFIVKPALLSDRLKQLLVQMCVGSWRCLPASFSKK